MTSKRDSSRTASGDIAARLGGDDGVPSLHAVRFRVALSLLLAVLVTASCASDDGSGPTGGSAKAAPQNVCGWLSSDWRDGANLSDGTPDGPGICNYDDTLDGGRKVRISVEARGGRPEDAMRSGKE